MISGGGSYSFESRDELVKKKTVSYLRKSIKFATIDCMADLPMSVHIPSLCV